MKIDDDLKVYVYAAGIVLVPTVVGAIGGQAPIGFFLGCVASVFYLRHHEN